MLRIATSDFFSFRESINEFIKRLNFSSEKETFLFNSISSFFNSFSPFTFSTFVFNKFFRLGVSLLIISFSELGFSIISLTFSSFFVANKFLRLGVSLLIISFSDFGFSIIFLTFSSFISFLNSFFSGVSICSSLDFSVFFFDSEQILINAISV